MSLLSQPPQPAQLTPSAGAPQAAEGHEPADVASTPADPVSQPPAAVVASLASGEPIDAASWQPATGPGTGPAARPAGPPARPTTGTDPTEAAAPASADLPFAAPFKAVVAAASPPVDAAADETVIPAQRTTDVTGGSDPSSDPSALGASFIPGHAAPDAPVPASPTVQTPVGASDWAEEIGTHVVWMAHQGVTAASLRLQPEHLGPLEIRISLHDTAASVWFGASESETRTALQASLPQLRELFAAQGMTLTDAGVSREPPRGSQSSVGGTARPAVAVAAATDAASITGTRRGLIDTYA